MAAGVAVAVGHISARDIFIFQGNVYVGPARSIGYTWINLGHGAVCMALAGHQTEEFWLKSELRQERSLSRQLAATSGCFERIYGRGQNVRCPGSQQSPRRQGSGEDKEIECRGLFAHRMAGARFIVRPTRATVNTI